MPGEKYRSIKDPELYEKLREEGNSKEKSARISNAAAKEGRSEIGRRGGEAENYEELTVPKLKERAKEIGLTGYSRQTKPQLIDTLRNH